MRNKFKISISFIFIFLALALSIRGISGNIDYDYFTSRYWQGNGPLELSPEKGRFVLLYSLVERNTDKLDSELAGFAVPDVGYINGGYVSLFTPGVTFLAIPGYIIGSYFNLSQVGSFATITIFAFANSILIFAILRKLEVNQIISLISSIIFLFATPAFAYAVSFYQHHVSVFLILLAVYLLIGRLTWYKVALVWFLFGASIIVDNPNAFIMLPVIIYSFIKLFEIKIYKKSIRFKTNIFMLLSVVSILIPIGFYGFFNNQAYGNPFILSGAVRSVDYIDHEGNPGFFERLDNPDQKSENLFSLFYTRNLVNGIYTHIFSPDRGLIYYTPIMFLALIGLSRLKKLKSEIVLLLSILIVNIIIYSLWGDPWGGWAFGSRYLIPSYAVLSIVLGFTISKVDSRIFLFLIGILGSYSIAVNTLGALTTNKVPPKVQVLELERISSKEQKYTFVRNYQYLQEEGVKSYVYGEYLGNKVTPSEFYSIMAVLLVIGLNSLLVLHTLESYSLEGKNYLTINAINKVRFLPILNRL